MTHKKKEAVAVRNLLRPFFNTRKTNPFWKNIQGVRALCSAEEVEAICRSVEDKRHYPFPGMGNTFPSDQGTIPFSKFSRLTPLSEKRELDIQLARIRHHADRLENALTSLSSVNSLIRLGDPALPAIGTIESHIRECGWSLVILRKYLLATLINGGLPALNAQVRDITGRYPIKAWGVYCHCLYDMIDPTFDPSSATRHWLSNLVPSADAVHWYARPLSFSITGYPGTSAIRSETLLRISTCSLLDLTLFIWQNGWNSERPFGDVTDRLPSGLARILRDNFLNIAIRPAAAYLTPSGGVSDIELFRQAFIFGDIAKVADWKASFNTLVLSNDEISEFPPSSWVNHIRSEVKSAELEPAAIDILVESQRGWQKEWLSPDLNVENQDLLHATVLAYALRQNSSALVTNRSQLAEAISATDDVHEYVSHEKVIGLASDNDDDLDILDFVFRNLLFRKYRTRDNDLERRLVLMRLVERSTATRLGDFIRQVADENPRVAMEIARTCTRIFLERLFLLMSSIKDVIVTRLDICDWLVTQGGGDAETLAEESASLHRELANLDTRSDLDSTRIHVDEDSLRDWFNETQKSALARYVQTVSAEGPTTSTTTLLRFLAAKDRAQGDEDVRIDSQVGSEFLLLGIFSTTLNAFVSDKSFGLDAYLSRRIRHGTLSGSIMTPLARVTKLIDEIDSVSTAQTETGESDFASLANSWRKEVGTALDVARKDIIQLRSDAQPNGLIRADWRTAANIAHVDAAISRIRSRVIEARGNYDVFADLYALCWDCIEPDLAQLRRYLLRDLLPSQTDGLVEIWRRLEPRTQVVAHPYMRELVSVFQKKVHEVCGWFIRPVFRRDSYSLRMLVASTLSIVRELDDTYSFDEEINIPDEVNLNRASFDVFGDLFFVIIGNAAKYGAKDSVIRVSSEVSDTSDCPDAIILVEIQSFTNTADDHQLAVSRIRDAMSTHHAGIETAAVGEGFSGLRKAVGIVNNIRSDRAALAFYADADIREIRFAIYLPAEIAVNRGAA